MRGSGLFEAPAQGHSAEYGSETCPADHNRRDGEHLFEDVHSVHCIGLAGRMGQRSWQSFPLTVAYNDRKVTYCDRNFWKTRFLKLGRIQVFVFSKDAAKLSGTGGNVG